MRAGSRDPEQEPAVQPINIVTAIAAGLLVLSACAAAGPADGAEQRTEGSATGPASGWARAVVPIDGNAANYDTILEAARDARFVLLGESTHGTHEFYRERGRISDRLIRELGFGAVAIEGDWSATYRVNRYVRGLGLEKSAEQALAGYRNFPQWM